MAVSKGLGGDLRLKRIDGELQRYLIRDSTRASSGSGSFRVLEPIFCPAFDVLEDFLYFFRLLHD